MMFLLLFLVATASFAASQENTVLMVIGGRDDHVKREDGNITAYNTSLISHAEMIGCPSLVSMPKYPTFLSGHAAAAAGIICGGFTGLEEHRYVNATDKCYQYSPDQTSWLEVASMGKLRIQHYMADIKGDIWIMGGNGVTADNTPGDYDYSIQKLVGNSWVDEGHELPNIHIDCITVANEMVYIISNKYRDNVTMEIDPVTWTPRNISSGPNFSPSYCLPYQAHDGTPGIFSKFGEWLNITSGEWIRNSHSYANMVNSAVTSFRGNPVKVGGWKCVLTEGISSWQCDVLGDVMEFNEDALNWTMSYQLQYTRTFPVVMEVPEKTCNGLPPATTTPAPRTSTSTTTPTTAPTTTTEVITEPTMTVPPNDGTVVMVLGGRDDHYSNNVNSNETIYNRTLLSHVELFGCPETTLISPYPTPLGSHASTGLLTSFDNTAMVCGGATGIANQRYSNFTDKCYTYDPAGDQWNEMEPMPSIRVLHFMLDFPTSEGSLPAIAGGYNVTENGTLTPVYIDKVELLKENGWIDSGFKLPNISISCMVMVDGQLYVISSRIRDNVIMRIDPTTWETTNVGKGSRFTSDYCIPYTYGGYPGIFTKFAEWYNITSGEWHFAVHNYQSITGSAISLYQGKPTKFGGWKCQPVGGGVKCDVEDEVVQYQAETDSWNIIGKLQQARTHAMAVRVPGALCNEVTPSPPQNSTMISTTADPTNSTMTTTTAPPTTSTITPQVTTTGEITEPTMTVPPNDGTVVMVLGGRDDHYSNNVNSNETIYTRTLLSHVELFGCPETTPISPYPTPLGSHASTGLIASFDNTAMVCGGATGITNQRYSDFTDKCYTYDPEENEWDEEESMPSIRVLHFMLDLPTSEGNLPAIAGGYDVTESGTIISNYINKVEILKDDDWIDSDKKLPNISISCMVMVDGKLYVISSRIRDNVIMRIDPSTWETTNVGNGSRFTSDYCIPYSYGGHPGIFTKFAEWYNITSGEWHFAVHDYQSITGSAISLYQGKPTKFGGWKCQPTGGGVKCDVEDEVVQYQAETDSWNVIGRLQQARTHPMAVRVPATLCNRVTPTHTTNPSDFTTPSDASTLNIHYLTSFGIFMVLCLFL